MAVAAGSGFVWFLASALAVQAVQPRRVAATPISEYLRGPASGWLQAAYYVLAISLVLLGGRMPDLPRPVRGRTAAVLLVLVGGGVALAAYTYSPWPLPGDPSLALRVRMHIFSAFAAFGAVTIAIFLTTSALWNGAPRRLYLVLAGIILALELLGYFAPLFIPGAYGALEKLSIAGIVVWLLGASIRLAARDRPAPSRGAPS